VIDGSMIDVDVIVLNGASSSGKTSIVGELQRHLPRTFLAFGVDTLVDALPPASPAEHSGIEFAADGRVIVDERFAALEHAWHVGLAAMARSGVGVIFDDVFLSGAASQARLRSALDGLRTVWVGVHVDVDVAVAREAARLDRTVGMAASQAGVVHSGVQYDVDVDTTTASAAQCARSIIEYLLRPASSPA
jgi:chloramphenicol 3-O phosphotransferase